MNLDREIVPTDEARAGRSKSELIKVLEELSTVAEKAYNALLLWKDDEDGVFYTDAEGICPAHMVFWQCAMDDEAERAEQPMAIFLTDILSSLKAEKD
jgi:rhamnogalacturonyl hydrolase YesR